MANGIKCRNLACILLIAAGLVFYLYYGFFKMLHSGFADAGGDFMRGVLAARSFMEGRSVYLMPPGENPYFYFPAVTLLFLPFYGMSPAAAKLVWFAFSHLLAVFSFLVAYSYGSGRNKLLSAAAASTAVLLCMPLYQNLFNGNVNILIFAGLFLACRLFLSGRAGRVPVLIAVFSALKIFPAGLMAVFLREGAGAAWRRFALVLLAGLGVTLAVFGPGSVAEFARQLPQLDRFVGMFHCMSLSFVIKLFFPEAGGPALAAASAGLFLALAGLWWKKSGRAPGGREAAAAGLFSLTAALLVTAPSSWVMYSAFFSVPFYFVVYGLLSGRPRFRFPWLFAAILLFFNFWEIIYYHLPLLPAGLTPDRLDLAREEHVVLYRAVFSAHFALGLIFFAWLQVNHDRMLELLKEFSSDRN